MQVEQNSRAQKELCTLLFKLKTAADGGSFLCVK